MKNIKTHYCWMIIIGLMVVICSYLRSQDRAHLHDDLQYYNYDTKEWYRTSDGVVTGRYELSVTLPGGSLKKKADGYLHGIWDELGHVRSMEDVLVYQGTVKNPRGYLVRYSQFHHNVSVRGRQIILFFNKQQELTQFINSTKPVMPETRHEPLIDSVLALNEALSLTGFDHDRTVKSCELMVASDAEYPELVWHMSLVSFARSEQWEVDVNAATGDIISAKNTTDYHNGHGSVFEVNPTFSARTPYGTHSDFVDGQDANNPSLEAALVDIQLPGISRVGNMYRLEGPNVTMYRRAGGFSNWERDDQYDQASTDFRFTRDEDGFEAVMFYYHMDKNLRYLRDDLGFDLRPLHYSGPLRVVPRVENEHRGGYYSNHDVIELGDGNRWVGSPPNATLQHNVDNGEDAFIILHELGHALHQWSVGSAIAASAEGLREGIADYWGFSNTRDASRMDWYRDWESEYYRLYQWGSLPRLLNSNTTANKTEDYCTAEIMPSDDIYIISNWFLTPLVRIYNDLGKRKTDELFLSTLPALVDHGINDLKQAGIQVYYAAVDLGFTDEELCVVYQHLSDVLCIDDIIVGPTASLGDYYMEDTPEDTGIEANPDDGPMWVSEDIWLRQEDDGGLVHQQPMYNVTNYVYVRIRNAGCTLSPQSQLRLYYNLSATDLRWPLTWNNYYLTSECCYVAAGDEITSTPVSVAAIPPGGDIILSVPWTPPSHDLFPIDANQYGLLARLESAADPMHVPEVEQTLVNVRNNNNIALRNIAALKYMAPNTVILGRLDGGKIGFKSSNDQELSFLEMGDLYVSLSPAQCAARINGTIVANGFEYVDDCTLKAIDDNCYIQGLSELFEAQSIDVAFHPHDLTIPISIDLVAMNDAGDLIGGRRLQFSDTSLSLQRRGHTSISIDDQKSVVYPNPAGDRLVIRFEDVPDDKISVIIYDVHGKCILHYNALDLSNGELAIKVGNLPSGLYLLSLSMIDGTLMETHKWIKK